MFFEKVSLVTGGFDPIHSGHISYFKRAKDLSNYLIVGLNTEEWLTRKKGQYFQSWKERAEIIRHLNMVDAVISWDDSDDTAKGAIRKCLEISKQVIFCNGGDRGSSNTPEVMGFANHENVISFISDFPTELDLDKSIDYELQFEKAFLEPVKVILDAIGWNVEKVVNLELFFS